MKFLVTKELIEKILNYLVTRPYGEVYQLIAELAKLKPTEEAKDGSTP